MNEVTEIREDESQLRIYCAGPLFNEAERDEMTAIANALCAYGYAVYLPHRDGMEFRLILEKLVERGFEKPTAAAFLHAAIFALDIFQLAEECDAMVWNLNGRVPDEGAVSEAAIAWTLGKPLVAYKDDVRSLITGRDNPLLAGLVNFETVQEIEKLPEILSRTIVQHLDRQIGPSQWPDKLQLAAEQGSRLWSLMQEHQTKPEEHQNDIIAELVIELFAPSKSSA